MSLFISYGRKQPKKGNRVYFWEIKETFWDKQIKKTRQRFIGYLGKEPTLTESKAQKICEKRGITMEQLRKVNRLIIIPDPEPEETKERHAT